MARLFKLEIAPGRVYGLDLIRFFAIVTVLYGHSRHLIRPYINERIYMLPVADAVSLFFVTSGFLIGLILLKTITQTNFGTRELLNFWTRRWYRTLPNYYLVLLVIFFLTWWLKGFRPRPHFFLFLQNLYQPVATNNFFPESWSLAVEEWFYLVVPILLFAGTTVFRNKRGVFLGTTIMVLVAVTAFRTYLAVHLQCADLSCWINNIRQLVVTRVDSMMYGFIGAYGYFFYPEKWTRHRRTLFVIGVLLYLAPSVYDAVIGGYYFRNYFALTLAPLGTLLMLPLFTSIKTGSGFVYRWATRFSMISYSLYLLHYSVVQDLLLTVVPQKLAVFDGQEPWVCFSKYLLFWVLSVCFSILLYKYFEHPVMKLRAKKRYAG